MCGPIRIKMRSRLYFLGCIVLSCGFFVMTGNRQKSLKTIVKETRVQIETLKKNFKDEGKLLSVDDKYLKRLGLLLDGGTAADYYPDSNWRKVGNASEPVILSAVSSGRAGDAVHFVRNAQMFMPNTTVIIYDLGMSQHEHQLVLQYCNFTYSSNLTTGGNNVSYCFIRKFDPDRFYPAHVHKIRTNAYRPIIIQEVLLEAGCILWMDIDQRFVLKDLKPFLANTPSKGGVSAWLRDENIPTSSMTHPKMFRYLVRDKSLEDNFNFQHMVSLRALLIYNLKDVSCGLMADWVQCALLEDCIEPIGAQATGCRFDKKPQFRYSGCHDYDVSALNILLGQMFKFDESLYVIEDKFFVTVTEDEATNHSDDEAVTNSTETSNGAAMTNVTKDFGSSSTNNVDILTLFTNS